MRATLGVNLGVNLGVKKVNPLHTAVWKGFLRSEADSNRCKWFCRPVPNPSAIRPYPARVEVGTSHLSECKDTYFLINSKFYAKFFALLND